MHTPLMSRDENCPGLQMRAVFLFLLIFVARECMAQDAGAPPLGTLTPRLEGADSNGPQPGQSRKSYLIPAIEIIGFDLVLATFASDEALVTCAFACGPAGRAIAVI